jgi:hypothetical protein
LSTETIYACIIWAIRTASLAHLIFLGLNCYRMYHLFNKISQCRKPNITVTRRLSSKRFSQSERNHTENTLVRKLIVDSIDYILSRDGVTIDGVWIGNRIYWTLPDRHYK